VSLGWLSFMTGVTGDDALERWLAWLLTYWLHSVLMCGAALLLARAEGASPAVRQRFWQAAIVLPFATSLLALTEPLRGLHPSVFECLGAVTGRLSAADTLAASVPDAAPTLPSAPYVDAARNGGAAWGTALNLVTLCLLAAWAGVAALRLLRLALSAEVLRRKLRTRLMVSDTRLLQRLRTVSTRARLSEPVVLTTLSDVAGPFSLGRAEICVPADALTSFSDAEVDAVFAHELAHLERRDWLTFPVISVLGSVLCVQPLNLWLAARFRNDAELACDDRAVELTNDPESLARALLRVAERIVSTRSLDLLPAVARPKGVLLARARRLLTVDGRSRRSRRAPSWRSSIGTLALIAALSPGLGVAAGTPRTMALFAAKTGTSPAVDRRLTPDATQLELELNGLQRQELRVQGELAALHSGRASDLEADTAPRLLELEQELRHLQQTQAWLQQRFDDQRQVWEARRGASSETSRP
jgi:beta-lactamase regulating signal transducer with metallopeptidase domain